MEVTHEGPFWGVVNVLYIELGSSLTCTLKICILYINYISINKFLKASLVWICRCFYSFIFLHSINMSPKVQLIRPPTPKRARIFLLPLPLLGVPTFPIWPTIILFILRDLNYTPKFLHSRTCHHPSIINRCVYIVSLVKLLRNMNCAIYINM